MSKLLPDSDEIRVTPEEIIQYLNPDGLRMLLRQERIRWGLKPNRDSDYYSNTTLFRYSGDLHNEGDHQRMDIRVFPDNGANPGYAGIYVDGGEFGMVHNHEHWDGAMSDDSRSSISPRVEIGAESTHIPNSDSSLPIAGGRELPAMTGHGMNPESKQVEAGSYVRTAGHIYDSYDGRPYVLSNDENVYINNDNRDQSARLPGRSAARICDIPVNIADLNNQTNYVSDWDYNHTDNNFTHSHRFTLENIDDRTFVYPEISTDADGNYVNKFHPRLNGFSKDVVPGIFCSVSELLSVDLLRQKRGPLTHADTPDGNRRHNYYQFDGIWEWQGYDPVEKIPGYDFGNQNPGNMEECTEPNLQPIPYHCAMSNYSTSDLYQWRYNRVEISWFPKDIKMSIVEPGHNYRSGDILRYPFGSKWLYYRVTVVGEDGAITDGYHINHAVTYFSQDPSTGAIGVGFKNQTSSGYGCRISIQASPTFNVIGTQLKNNLYAYVDMTPTEVSDNFGKWADTVLRCEPSDYIKRRSTATSPGYTGVNSGRGGPEPEPGSPETMFYEHGGNHTAGMHVHLFRYTIDTPGNTYEMIDGVKVYTGRWIDQGPMGIEQPTDVKALYLSNQDTNNFNNYYKFMLDILIDQFNRRGDSILAGSINSYTNAYLHTAQRDPWSGTDEPGPTQELYDSLISKGHEVRLLRPNESNDILDHQAFFRSQVDPITGNVMIEEITDRIVYVNLATRVVFMYNPEVKEDPNYGYGVQPRGWCPWAGTVTR